jgi:predicted transglutaminase-like protease
MNLQYTSKYEYGPVLQLEVKRFMKKYLIKLNEKRLKEKEEFEKNRENMSKEDIEKNYRKFGYDMEYDERWFKNNSKLLKWESRPYSGDIFSRTGEQKIFFNLMDENFKEHAENAIKQIPVEILFDEFEYFLNYITKTSDEQRYE